VQRYAYLIHRTDEGTDDDPDRTLSRGMRTTGQSPADVAAELLADNRVAHSYYDGPRRCWVWPHIDGEPVSRTAPSNATPYDG
jgi:hypothetical protein